MSRVTKLLFILCCVIFLCTLAYAASDCQERCCEEEYPKLVVEGQGKIETLADKAYFNIRLRAEEKKLARAFELSTEKINSISATLSTFGVKKEDIRNLGYVYHPLYEGKTIFSTIQRPTSYEVVYELKITIYNLDNLGKILVGLSEVSETTVYGLKYTSTKIEELKREALKKAAADAREKALKLAEGAGATLGKVMEITTTTQEYPLAQRQEFDFALGKQALMKEEPVAPQLESGYLEILGSCKIYYAIQ